MTASGSAPAVVSWLALGISLAAVVASGIRWLLDGAWMWVDALVAEVVGLEGGGRHCLIIQVRNRGRGPATIDQWEFILPDNRFTVGGEWRHGPEIPYRLRAGAGSRGCATTRRREPGWPWRIRIRR